MTASALPTHLRPGEILNTTLAGQPLVIVGSHPSGRAVILSQRGWQTLRYWKLTKLSTASGRVIAIGGTYKLSAARLLAGIEFSRSQVIAYANGNFLDLREENLLTPTYSRVYRERKARRNQPQQGTTELMRRPTPPGPSIVVPCNEDDRETTLVVRQRPAEQLLAFVNDDRETTIVAKQGNEAE